MKAPKLIRTYCPRCKRHTEHSVSLYKKGKERKDAIGRRRYNRKLEGYGGQPKPIQHKFSKTTKKQSLKLRCKECSYTTHRNGIRLRKMEIQV